MVEKLNVVQQVTATLTPSMVSMMPKMIDFLFADKLVILATTALIHGVTAVMNLATLHRTAPTRFLTQEHHATKTHLIQGINMPTLEGTDHNPPAMVTDMGDISTGHNHATIPTVTGAVAVSESTNHAPHPVTAAAHATLWLRDASIVICAVTHPTGIDTPHPALATSPTDITHATIPQTGASLAPATHTTLHRKHS